MSYIKNLSTFKKVLYASFILILLFNLLIPTIKGDDIYFLKAASNIKSGSYFAEMGIFLNHRYTTWSSRVVIEFFLVSLSNHLIIWKMLNTIIASIYILVMNYYFNMNKSINILLVIIVTLFTMPLSFFDETGWLATTTNYFWAIVFGLIAFYPFFQKIFNKKINPLFFTLALVVQLYASNQEQVDACLLGLTTFVILYLIYNKQKIWILLPSWILSLSEMIFILKSPGNKVRTLIETKHWLPEFANFSLTRKFELGFSSTGRTLFFDFRFSTLLFTLVLALLAIAVAKQRIIKIISFVPLTTCLVFLFFKTTDEKTTNMISTNVNRFLNEFTKFGTNISLHNSISWFQDLFILFLITVTSISIWLLLKNKKTATLTILLLAMGFASKFLMAFSPTIWASASRVNFILDLTVIMASIILLKEFEKEKPVETDKLINLVIPISIVMIFILS